jgi:ATP synthase protein I
MAAMGSIGPEGRKQLELTAQFAAAGLVLVVAIVVGYFGGRALDRWLGTEPYCGYVGLVFGVVAGFRNLFQLARRASKSTPASPSESASKDDLQG